MAAVPKLVEFHKAAIGGTAFDGLRNNGITTAGTREAGGFGEGTEFNSNIFGALDFIDGAGDIVFCDIGSISSVKEDYRFIFMGIIHPFFQFCAGKCGAGRIIGAAKVNHIHALFGQCRSKIVAGIAGQVGDTFKVAILLQCARTACHNIGV